jgi:hypothetical protein
VEIFEYSERFFKTGNGCMQRLVISDPWVSGAGEEGFNQLARNSGAIASDRERSASADNGFRQFGANKM